MPLPIALSFVKGDSLLVSWYLMSSYLYYLHEVSLLHDHEYDLLCKELLSRWDKVEHPHKHLVSKEDLMAGTGFTLREEDYPSITKNAARQLAVQRGLL